jgi:uncharacterized protein (UPF0332 family)
MTLSQEERNMVIDYRIEKAKEAFEGAEANVSQLKNWAIAGNRLYYAVYYITSALLIRNKHVAHTHAGTRNFFHQYFVKTGVVSKELGHTYDKLFETRQHSDYDDFYDLEEQDVLPLIEQTKRFIDEIEKLINERE